VRSDTQSIEGGGQFLFIVGVDIGLKLTDIIFRLKVGTSFKKQLHNFSKTVL
jgi:hypothetical protein